jgi:hypothetical protein
MGISAGVNMKKIQIKLTEAEAETLSDVIGDYADYMRQLFGDSLKAGNCMEYRGKEIEMLNDVRSRILKALEDSHDNR